MFDKRSKRIKVVALPEPEPMTAEEIKDGLAIDPDGQTARAIAAVLRGLEEQEREAANDPRQTDAITANFTHRAEALREARFELTRRIRDNASQ